MNWVYNDGGREKSGFKGQCGDCVCRAIAIATEQPYEKVYKDLNQSARSFNKLKVRRGQKTSSSRNGTHKSVYTKYLKELGWKWVTCMFIGKGCKVHLKKEELPSGRIITSLSRHMAAVIDGELHDTYDCSRHGNRCVYGYFIKEPK